MTQPLIAVTMGDPAGIGPEIIARDLRRRRLPGTESGHRRRRRWDSGAGRAPAGPGAARKRRRRTRGCEVRAWLRRCDLRDRPAWGSTFRRAGREGRRCGLSLRPEGDGAGERGACRGDSDCAAQQGGHASGRPQVSWSHRDPCRTDEHERLRYDARHRRVEGDPRLHPHLFEGGHRAGKARTRACRHPSRPRVVAETRCREPAGGRRWL